MQFRRNGGNAPREDWGDRVEVHTLSRNIGASGGFNAGIRVAYQSGADFVWVMDDDVLPKKDALAKLVEADQFLADRGVARAFVLSSAWTEDGNVTNVPKIDTRPDARGYETWPFYPARRIVPVTGATFVSILLPRSIIAQYGLPLAPMFIWGEAFRIYASDHREMSGVSCVGKPSSAFKTAKRRRKHPDGSR